MIGRHLTKWIWHTYQTMLDTTMATTLDDINDSITTYDKCNDVNLAASALVKTGAGQIYGIVINSHSSGTIKLWDNTSAAVPVLIDTITLSAVATTGERFIPFFGGTFNTGLYVTIGGTANITVFYR